MLFGQYPFDARDPGFARKVVAGEYGLPERIPVRGLLGLWVEGGVKGLAECWRCDT